MRKLVLGIIAVVCVQFAFVIYTQLQSPLDLAAVSEFTPSPSVNMDPSWLVELDRSGLPAPEPAARPVRVEPQRSIEFAPAPRVTEPAYLPAEPRLARHLGDRSFRRTKAYFTDPPEAAPGDFETVVISYNRASEFADCDRFDPPKAKKRSVIPRAAVIKKPVEWVRSLATKLY